MLVTLLPPLDESLRLCLKQLLSLGRGKHTHRLALFGDGAAGDPDPLVAEEPDEILVAQRIVPPFASYDFQDLLLDRLGTDMRPPPVPVQAGIEEKLQLEDPVGSAYVLAARHPGHRRLMHGDVLRDVPERKGLHEFRPALEKIPLELHDAFDDLVDGPLPLLDALDEPECGVDLLLQELPVLLAEPVPGGEKVPVIRTEPAAWPNVLVVKLQTPRDGRDVPAGEEVEVVGEDRQGE